MSKKVEAKQVETVVAKRKSMGMKALLNSKEKGCKIAGILKMFGEVEVLNGAEKQTVSNKTSKAGGNLRDMSEEDISSDDNLINAMKLVSSNFGSLKDAMTQKEVKLSEEMSEVYTTLLSYGKSKKSDGIPDTFEF